MSVARKILIYGTLILIGVGILGGALYYYNKIKRNYSSPLEAIPLNTSIFF